MEDEDYNPHVENEKITRAFDTVTDYKVKYEALLEKYLILTDLYVEELKKR